MSCGSILNENRAYWTERAATYSEVNQSELKDAHRANWSKAICQRIQAHFPGSAPSELRILEVGTGPGFFAIILTEAGYRVTAVDLTPSMLAEARKNAGALAPRIDFREMNAEALSFADESFDVIVTRNLTWNLPHPEAGYSEWCRVLKKGGLLLNFDANWYNYLFDEEAKAAYERDRENTASRGFDDQNVGENFDVMEKIAHRLQLSPVHRPAWDIDILSHRGMKVTAEQSIWKEVWSAEEQVSFASTPMFLIKAVRS